MNVCPEDTEGTLDQVALISLTTLGALSHTAYTYAACRCIFPLSLVSAGQVVAPKRHLPVGWKRIAELMPSWAINSRSVVRSTGPLVNKRTKSPISRKKRHRVHCLASETLSLPPQAVDDVLKLSNSLSDHSEHRYCTMFPKNSNIQVFDIMIEQQAQDFQRANYSLVMYLT